MALALASWTPVPVPRTSRLRLISLLLLPLSCQLLSFLDPLCKFLTEKEKARVVIKAVARHWIHLPLNYHESQGATSKEPVATGYLCSKRTGVQSKLFPKVQG